MIQITRNPYEKYTKQNFGIEKIVFQYSIENNIILLQFGTSTKPEELNTLLTLQVLDTMPRGIQRLLYIYSNSETLPLETQKFRINSSK